MRSIFKKIDHYYDFYKVMDDGSISKSWAWGITCETIKDARKMMLDDFNNGYFEELTIVK